MQRNSEEGPVYNVYQGSEIDEEKKIFPFQWQLAEIGQSYIHYLTCSFNFSYEEVGFVLKLALKRTKLWRVFRRDQISSIAIDSVDRDRTK